ncbi:MAG: 1-acyl-sn-glycerol-3-phosphate acyltransferase [Oscillospiraceae bacterium]|jgi:DNA-directed RNA polymerase subunit RPC12/RpoP|nr:1-acyl-sn-glycerol-3-phosphate acyltransferase [Oscillospiraceae bacterium]
MIGDFKRFDMARRPVSQKRYLTPVTWAISFPIKWMKHSKIFKSDMDGIKPPYLLLCNHNAFIDFMIMTAAIFPRRASYVVAIDGFIGKEWLLRKVGGIGIRKFTSSVQLVKNMMHAKENGQIVVLFPEARYSLCGTNAVLPNSIGKFIRFLDIPVVTLIMHGHHISNPFWGKKRRISDLRAEMRPLFTRAQTQTLSVDEMNERVREAFVYDDFKWQRENGIEIKSRDRAAGLHKVLYQCPHCGAEYKMTSALDEIWCSECGKRWVMTTLGELYAKNPETDGETEFSHVPDWYEWERENVRREVEDGTYSLEVSARVDSLPNARGFVDLGHATLTHNMDGFTLSGVYDGEVYTERWKPLALYSCHIEYNYRKQGGDCVDLNTLNDTLYIYPEGQNVSVTKIALATEELYNLATRRLQEEKNAAEAAN